MARKPYTAEQIVGLPREAEDRLGLAQAIGVICRGVGISKQSLISLTTWLWRVETRSGQAVQGT